MKLIVGLGNPGEKYENTRHNLGFRALDKLLEAFEPQKETFWENMDDPHSILKKQKKTFAQVKVINAKPSTKLVLGKPQTFMNNSGHAVARLLSFYKIEPSELTVIYDDSDIPLGKLRVRFGGASGGHLGMQSIIDTIGTDKFLRIRLGIGRPTDERKGKEKRKHLDRYVLQEFQGKDRNEIKHMIKEAVKTVELILKHGLETYMSRYHSK